MFCCSVHALFTLFDQYHVASIHSRDCFTALNCYINSADCLTSIIDLKYFTSGHTFMSADYED